MSDSFSSELLREMEDALLQSQQDNEVSNTIIYTIICGLRNGSKVLWIPDENQLFYRNSHSSKTKLTQYSCRKNNCSVKVYVRPDGTAFKDDIEMHTHGSQYMDYKFMRCENKMKETAKAAPASISPYEIYMDVVVQ